MLRYRLPGEAASEQFPNAAQTPEASKLIVLKNTAG
jgi:hypothetical protein